MNSAQFHIERFYTSPLVKRREKETLVTKQESMLRALWRLDEKEKSQQRYFLKEEA